MPKWNVTIPEETDRLVRGFLARRGTKKGDLSAFVDDAAKSEVLRRSARELQSRDSTMNDAEALQLAETLAELDRGMQDALAGKGEPLEDALHDIADRLGLTLTRRRRRS